MKIVVWSKPACVQCNAVKRALDQANVPFELKRIDQDEDQLKLFKEQGLMQAPIVEAEGFETFSGYNPNTTKAIIEAHKASQA